MPCPGPRSYQAPTHTLSICKTLILVVCGLPKPRPNKPRKYKNLCKTKTQFCSNDFLVTVHLSVLLLRFISVVSDSRSTNCFRGVFFPGSLLPSKPHVVRETQKSDSCLQPNTSTTLRHSNEGPCCSDAAWHMLPSRCAADTTTQFQTPRTPC